MNAKLWLKIGEAARLLGVSPKELRYWESVIPEIRPRRSKGNLRYYHVEELPRLERIRDWLREGLTVADCQQLLKTGQLRRGLGLEVPEPEPSPATPPARAAKVAVVEVPPRIQEARKALSDLLDRLSAGPKPAPARRPSPRRRAAAEPAPVDPAPPAPPARPPRPRRNPPAAPADPNDFGPLFNPDQGR